MDENMKMLALVRSRYQELLWQGCIREYLNMGHDASLKPEAMVKGDAPDTYCWADLDYTDQSRTDWRAARHYNRLLRMVFQEGRARLSEDSDYRARVIGALRYWLIHDYTNPNWWHNDIGMPTHMTALGLMLWAVLPEDVREGVVGLAARGSMKTRQDIPRWTGANLIWGVSNSLRHALLTDDVELLGATAKRAAQEIYAGNTEGIQEDGSFCQHGPRWYSGGYGCNFTFDLAQLIYVLAGTPWAFPKDKLDIFLLHVLDGQRNMMHHGYFDYNGVGRELTRRGALGTKLICYGVDLLARIEDIPRREELQAFCEQNHFGAAVDPTSAFAVTRHYPKVSYLAHNKNGTHIGVKCHAPGQYDMEVCNAEGHLCYNMSYGTRTCYMRRGDEYFDTNPIYDFAHMPGTTARLETDDQLKIRMDWWCLPLPNDHTGGMALGDRGIIYERPEHDGISAMVSFFAFDGCLVSLGADIRDEHPERGALTTTVDQCRVSDPICVADGMRADNGAFTYLNLDTSTRFVAGVQAREGSWHRNSYEEEYQKETGELFLCYIPVEKQGATFAYAVCPRDEICSVRVVSNTAACQAIMLADGTLMTVFHEDSMLDVNGKRISGRAGQCTIIEAYIGKGEYI